MMPKELDEFSDSIWSSYKKENSQLSDEKGHHDHYDKTNDSKTITVKKPENKAETLKKLSASLFSTNQTSVRCHTPPPGYTDRDVDSGYAWIILAVIFVINSSTFGTSRAYGLIFEKLARQDQKRSQAALPFTIMGATENMAGPLVGYLLTKSSWRLVVFLGCCLITLGHLLAAFFQIPIGQIVTVGLMNGLGQSCVTISSFQINNAYFVRYRSRAFGLGLAGAAFGAFYISPTCQYILDNHSISVCYLVLSLILSPNVILSMLLKPKKTEKIPSISARVEKQEQVTQQTWISIKEIIRTPVFHLIWLTQLLFCWLNFVFGMIIVDFGKDRNLDTSQLSRLIPVWAVGQLVGRLLLGSVMDMELMPHKLFTSVCFFLIGGATWALNNIRIDQYQGLTIIILVFILSIFISNLYVLFNELMVTYMGKSQLAISFGMSSFIGSFFLLPRAYIIGHYRDTNGNYDDMLIMFSYITIVAAFVWLIIEPKS